MKRHTHIGEQWNREIKTERFLNHVMQVVDDPLTNTNKQLRDGGGPGLRQVWRGSILPRRVLPSLGERMNGFGSHRI
jgi:hypothetical protein